MPGGKDVGLIFGVDPVSKGIISNQIKSIVKGVEPVKLTVKFDYKSMMDQVKALRNMNINIDTGATTGGGSKNGKQSGKSSESNRRSRSGTDTVIAAQTADAKKLNSIYERLNVTQGRLYKLRKKMQSVSVGSQERQAIESTVKGLEMQEKILTRIAQRNKDIAQYQKLNDKYESKKEKNAKDLAISQSVASGRARDKQYSAGQKSELKDLRSVAKQIDSVRSQTYSYQKKLQSRSVSGNERAQINEEVKALREKKRALIDVANSYRDAPQYAEIMAESARKQAESDQKLAASGRVTAAKEKDKVASLKQVLALYRQLDKYINKNPQITSHQDGRDIVAYRDQLRSAISESVLLGKQTTSIKTNAFTAMSNDVKVLQNNLREAGVEGQNFTQWIGSAYKRYGSWMLVTRSITALTAGLRDMVGMVVEIDSAMTELKKVTNESDEAYANFLDGASKRAKSIGATMTDTISATADAARLGYNIEDASKLADSFLIYQNVGDEISDIDQASKNVISTMKGFGIEAKDSMSIVDKFNEVANNYAISAGGIGDALSRSAAALSAGNNTIDESMGLIVAANDVIQDPDVVGKRLPNSAVMY